MGGEVWGRVWVYTPYDTRRGVWLQSKAITSNPTHRHTRRQTSHAHLSPKKSQPSPTPTPPARGPLRPGPSGGMVRFCRVSSVHVSVYMCVCECVSCVCVCVVASVGRHLGVHAPLYTIHRFPAKSFQHTHTPPKTKAPSTATPAATALAPTPTSARLGRRCRRSGGGVRMGVKVGAGGWGGGFPRRTGRCSRRMLTWRPGGGRSGGC